MYQKTVLDNGLRIVTSAMPHTRSVCLGIFVGAGSRYEDAEKAGLSHFIEHLCFKGTQRRGTTKEISEAIEGVGGMLNGATDKEMTVYWCKVARPHFRLALDVLADMLRYSKFDPVEVEKERGVIIEELGVLMDTPHQRVDVLIDEVIWPNQPLGREVMGTKETVSALSREMMLSYLSHQYVPSNTVVSIAGNISHEEVVASISDAFGDWPGGRPEAWYPANDDQEAPRICLERRDTEQAHICLGIRGLSITHPDRFTLNLLNIILGEGMSSRLFLEIRERRGLAYDIHSYVNHYLDSGSIIIYAGVTPKLVGDAIEAILVELNRLKEDIPESEIIKAKELGKGRLMLRMEDTRSVAGWMGGQELLTGHIRTVDEVVSIIDSIAPEELKRVARGLLVTERLNLAIVGPLEGRKRLESLLRL